MNEFLEQFLVEARELVEQATSDLLALERAPSDRESLDSAFRAFHTLKGGAGIVDFDAMGRATHAAEEVLSAVRAGERPIAPGLIGDCLSCVDRIVQWLDAIEDNGALPVDADRDAERIVGRLSANSESLSAETESPLAPIASPLAILKNQLSLVTDEGPGAQGRMASAARLAVNVLRHLDRFEEAERIAHSVLGSDAQIDRLALVGAIERAVGLLGEEPQFGGIESAANRADPLSRNLRVDAKYVNALVNLAAELTVAKNAVGHIAKLAQEQRNALTSQIRGEHERLDRLVSALQQAVLELRVLPLRNVFQRFSRVVREMSISLAKPVRLSIEGEETEADKAIVEMLFEPLLHVVRNAMDHGVEPGPERAAAGKPTIANLHLRARREGDHVLVEVADDGRGIDVGRLRRVAIERGVASLEAVSAMSDEEAVGLIFVPGFSTAAEISNLSGRGVGMDAVRTSVERLGGRVEVSTAPGVGSTVRFNLPFSVMMTRVMTVKAGGQMFGVPLDAIVETLLVERSDIRSIGRAKAFVLRNRTVPLIELCQTLGLNPSAESETATVVVVGLSGGQWSGLEVDELGERMNVMLKSPEGILSGVREIAGTTILGDGGVLLILDAKQLLQ
jgi:two-component system, chemotaxis family, sensor kinase CheA